MPPRQEGPAEEEDATPRGSPPLRSHPFAMLAQGSSEQGPARKAAQGSKLRPWHEVRARLKTESAGARECERRNERLQARVQVWAGV